MHLMFLYVDICIPANLLNLLISSNHFLVESSGLSTYNMLSANCGTFTYSFLVFEGLFFVFFLSDFLSWDF